VNIWFNGAAVPKEEAPQGPSAAGLPGS